MKLPEIVTCDEDATSQGPNSPSLGRDLLSLFRNFVKQPQKSRRKTWDRKSNHISPSASSAAEPDKTTPLTIPNMPTETAPNLSFQAPVDDYDKTLNVVSDRTTRGATELSSDTNMPAAQETSELEPTAGTMVVEEIGNTKRADNLDNGQDDIFLLLWNEAYDDLLDDNGLNLSRFDPSDLREWHRKENKHIIDGDGFEPIKPVTRLDKARRILEGLLAEPDLGEDESGIESNRETERTGLSMFKSIVRDVALREYHKAAAVAWIAVCNAADVSTINTPNLETLLS